MKDPQIPWLIWSNEHGKWWRSGGRGYTSVIGEAGRYMRRAANQILRDSNFAPGVVNEVAVLAPEAFDFILGAQGDDAKGILANLLVQGTSS